MLIHEVEFQLEADGTLILKIGMLQMPIKNLKIFHEQLAITRALLRSVPVSTY